MTLPLLQLIAMAKRDTLGMDAAIAEMSQRDFTDFQMHNAHTMRRGYLRVIPQETFGKSLVIPTPRLTTLRMGGKLQAISYPNPFNPTAIIEHALPEASRVTLRVFNVLGREVARLADGWQQEGVYTEVFDASRLPSGVYLYVLSTPFETVSGRMALEK